MSDRLRLRQGPFETARLGGFFGALRDALPDHWGRRVIARHGGLGEPSDFDLLLLGQAVTSMGGARPKIRVEADNALWLAKFPAPNDRWNQPRVEHGLLLLARSCGL